MNPPSGPLLIAKVRHLFDEAGQRVMAPATRKSLSPSKRLADSHNQPIIYFERDPLILSLSKDAR